MKQESTEAGVAECLESSDDVMALLLKYGIPLERITDYHRYPVADNTAPALAADRLEYTLGNLWNYGFADLREIRAAYEDLFVGTDETGTNELVFHTPEVAEWFSRMALKTSRIYIADEDRFAMQALADLLCRAVERGVIRYKDLWTTERAVLARLTADPVSKREWESFRAYSRLLRSSEQPETGYWVRIGAKRRWIDPYVSDLGRVSRWSAAAAEEMSALKETSFDLWLSALSE